MRTPTSRKPTELEVELYKRGLTSKVLAPRMAYSADHIGDVLSGRFPMTERFARMLSMASQIPLSVIQGDGA